MTKRYYSSRNKLTKLTIEDLYDRLQHLYLLFRDQDYFKEKGVLRKLIFLMSLIIKQHLRLVSRHFQ